MDVEPFAAFDERSIESVEGENTIGAVEIGYVVERQLRPSAVRDSR